MKNAISILFFNLLFLLASGQIQTDKEVHDTIYFHPEIFPQFPGGKQIMAEFLMQHLNYTSDSSNVHYDQQIIVQFVVETGGKIDDINLRKGDNLALFEAVKSVLLIMPLWSPGKMGDTPVAVYVQLPINIGLQ